MHQKNNQKNVFIRVFLWGLAYLYDYLLSPSVYERKSNSIKLYLKNVYYSLRWTTLEYNFSQDYIR